MIPFFFCLEQFRFQAGPFRGGLLPQLNQLFFQFLDLLLTAV
jgi:hypothetical protein